MLISHSIDVADDQRQRAGDEGCPMHRHGASLRERALVESRVQQIIQEWMISYLARTHPSMSRPGAICPFVKPALAAGNMEIRSVPAAGPHAERAALEAARGALAEFADLAADDSKKAHGALVIAFPDLLDQAHLIDDVHDQVKDEAVGAGLMIGQFHAECDEPSARNQRFLVNRSPIPLLAIRTMTVHDILFLHGSPAWFRAYETRFGHLYTGSHRIAPSFLALFDKAAAQFRDPVHEGVRG